MLTAVFMKHIICELINKVSFLISNMGSDGMKNMDI